jgi:branched-chain amino acid transport system substrate-binding protein
MATSRLRLVVALVGVVGVLGGGCGGSHAEAVRIGVLASCDGIWGYWYDGSIAASSLPLLERGARLTGPRPRDGLREGIVAGRPVELALGCGDGLSEVTLSEARRLVEREGVDVLIGPTTLAEAFAVRAYAAKHHEVTFVIGSASGQAITLGNPPDNLFRFTPAGTQWMAGLGSYAYHDLGWRKVVTLGDEWSFSYLLYAGFAAEFCSLGGTIVEAVWLPPGGDPARAAATVPRRGVDGFVAAGFPDIRVIERIPQLRGPLAGRLTGTSVVFSEPAVVEALGDRLDGLVYADPTGDGTLTSDRFIAGMKRFFPGIGEHVRTVAPPHYYTAMTAVVQALERVEGDLAGGQRRFRDALSRTEVDGASGRVRLDASRQATTTNYLVELARSSSGKLAPRLFRAVPNVEQTFNGYFGSDDPPLGRDTIKCKKGNPPPWTRR